MKERQVVIKGFARAYQRAGKKGKGEILDQVVEATGYRRRYAARLLRGHGRRVRIKGRTVFEADISERVRRPRMRIYGEEVKRELARLWETLDFISGRRLAAALPDLLEGLRRHGERTPPDGVRELLLKVSPSTIDRLLAPEKRRMRLKGRGGTKPGTLLRQQIPVRTFADWDDARPGFVEIDLVGHEGGNASGDFAQTLDVTDVASGWTELAAVRNKARVWVHEALKGIRERLPFPLLGLDSDNGGEFINGHLCKWCRDEGITFTRSRPLRKNDNCFVEQKNWSVVRRFVGYARHDTEPELETLNQLYGVLSLYVNHFLPSQRLRDKVRRGSRVTKRYHPPLTPYRRLLASPDLSKRAKAALRRSHRALNPAHLHREILTLQDRLLALHRAKTRAV